MCCLVQNLGTGGLFFSPYFLIPEEGVYAEKKIEIARKFRKRFYFPMGTVFRFHFKFPIRVKVERSSPDQLVIYKYYKTKFTAASVSLCVRHKLTN